MALRLTYVLEVIPTKGNYRMNMKTILQAVFAFLAASLPAPWNAVASRVWQWIAPYFDDAAPLMATPERPTLEPFTADVRTKLRDAIGNLGIVDRCIAGYFYAYVTDESIAYAYNRQFGDGLTAAVPADELTQACIDAINAA